MATNSTLAALQPIVERYITSSDGVQIYATAVGQSHLPSLVFVHGYAASSLVWASILANADLLKHFYLVAYDLRGHGRSGKPQTPDGYLSNLFAEDFANVAKEFGLNSPLFIGWSYGATIVPDLFTHLPPNTISGVTYIAPLPWLGPTPGDPIPSSLFSNDIFPGLTTLTNSTQTLDARLLLVDSLVNDPRSVPVQTKWGWIGQSTLVGPITTQLLFGRTQVVDPLLKAAEAGLPTLLLTGGKDQLVQAGPVKALLERNFTNLVVREVEEGSHALFYDFEEVVVEEVKRFAMSVFEKKTIEVDRV